MSFFHSLHASFAGLEPSVKTGGLPLWLSIAIIVALSALCWAVLVTIVLALRATI